MSYILEALKKSQRERELGQVPTLADAPHLSADKPVRGGYWGMAAVILALLALLIALYGAFADRLSPQGDTPHSPAETARKAAPEPTAPAPISAAVAAVPTVAATRDVPRPGVPRPEEPPKPAPAIPAAPESAAPAVAAAQDLPGQEERPITAPTISPPQPTPPPVQSDEPATPPAPSVVTAPARRLPPGAPEIPPDLVQDVRQFEEQLRQQQLMDARQAQDPQLAVPPVEPPAAVAEEPEPAVAFSDQDPQDVQEVAEEPEPATAFPDQDPGEVQEVAEEPEPEPVAAAPVKHQTPPRPQPVRTAALPGSTAPPGSTSVTELRLTVHVYSATAEQRFVIINSRKMREGERSPKGLLVEEITQEGVNIELQGQRLFLQR